VLRVLLIGCGDIALRTAALLRGRVHLYGVTRRTDDLPKLRAHGIVPILADLDRGDSLDRLRTAPFGVVHFAPPPSDGRDDPRTRRLIAALAKASIIPERFVYVSTSGVYGDCAGARVAETRPRRAQTPRARRRVAAESALRLWAARTGVTLCILRVPGIYAQSRLPLERVRAGTPVLVSDDAELKMGSWFDAVADAFRLPRPPRISWEEAENRIAPQLLSFMNESRRLVNRRMKRELRVRLRYAVPQALLADIAPRTPRKQLDLPLA